MPSSRPDNEDPPAGGPLISDSEIGPGSPPDAKDAFMLLVEGAGE